MLSFYETSIVPKLLNKWMSPEEFNDVRKSVVSRAKGVVLEIGCGSLYNLPFYKDIEKLYALEPSSQFFAYAKERVMSASFPVEYIEAKAEDIPLKDASVDSVVSTWTLCSVNDVEKVLQEIKRVLKPGGQFLFVEHGYYPDTWHATLQKILNPFHIACAGNCHLNRKIDIYLKESGLFIERMDMAKEEGSMIMFSYEGLAIKKKLEVE